MSFVVRLLLAFSLFTQAAVFGADLTNCGVPLSELAEHARAFEKRVKEVDTDSSENVRIWHLALIEKARVLLDAQKTVYIVHQTKDGLLEIEIKAVRGGSPLNDYALRRAQQLDGVQIFYCPIRLVAADGHLARAKFDGDKGRALAPHAQITNVNEIHESLEHEMLHAAFAALRRRGVETFLVGWLKASDPKRPLWKENHYSRQMSFEELATQSLNLKLRGEALEAALAKEGEFSRLTHPVGHKAELVELLGHNLGKYARGLIEYLDENPNRLLNLKGTADVDAGSPDPIYLTHWAHEGHVIKIPWVSGPEKTAAKTLQERDPQSSAGKAARRLIQESLRTKLKALSELAKELQGKAARIRKISESRKTMDKATAKQLADAARDLWKTIESVLPSELPF